ncbi:hypothetical protein GVN21_10100 [Caulobacter sp. SLTY]|uniref:hypothetical protein n=1 Tax=Caulobacter sp. SLTY TaxID=2683262 RepID=UPI0014131F99|nr:hypothetical protein [Caulobacter sp. SLTY]NBB15705.1 hypothetical protein [Caulobacter sp. SLTY]
MIVERTLAALATAAAVVAAVFVSIVAVFFTVYALVEPHWGAAGAGAVVAGTAALLAAIIAMIAARRMEGDHRRKAEEAQASQQAGGQPDMVQVLLHVVKDRPLLSAGAAIAMGVYAIRNPALISAVVRGFMDTRSKP